MQHEEKTNRRSGKTGGSRVRWKRWLPFVAFLLLTGGMFVYCRHIGVIGAVSISKAEGRWICCGPIQWGLRYPCTRPVLSGEKVVLVEKYPKEFYIEGFKIVEAKRNFLRDSYYIMALSLKSGRKVYRKKMTVNCHPLQVQGIWPWGENVVVWGYYQEKAGLNTRISMARILDAKGRAVNEFALNAKPMAVDGKNSMLICGAQTFVLPSGETRRSPSIKLLFSMDSDKNGNVYTLRRLKSCEEGDTEGIHDAVAEKYSSVTWTRHWSVKLTGTEERCPVDLRYDKGLVWYAVFAKVRDPQNHVYETMWVDKLLDAETGEIVETDLKFDPYRMETEFDGKQYFVTRVGNELLVKIEPVQPEAP